MHILIIARHYPPEVSGGARRPFLWVKYLRKAGHKVTIVCPFELDDKDSICVAHPVKHIKPDSAIGFEDKKTSAFRDFMRLWLLWPDPEIRWYNKVLKALLETKIKPDWIMTTSPPESAHIIGAKLARKLNRPWLAEFRDTWMINPHRAILAKSPLRRFVEKKIAKHVLKQAAAISAVSEFVMDEILDYAPRNIPNLVIGHFSEAAPGAAKKLDKNSFNLVHTGGFSLSDRRRALAPLLEIINRHAQDRNDIYLHLAGRLSEEELQLCQKPYSFRIRVYGEIPMQEARALQMGADALVLYTPEASHALPGKYAEYCYANKPIFYFGGGDWLSLVEDRAILFDLNNKLSQFNLKSPGYNIQNFSAEHATEKMERFLQKSSLFSDGN